jgi:transglutaminase-like putative cysteine protease
LERQGGERDSAARAVSCRLVLAVRGEAEAAFQITPALSSGTIEPEELLVDQSPMSGQQNLVDAHLGRIQLVELAAGTRTVEYRGTVVGRELDEAKADRAVRDLDRLVFLRPSRFCPSDRMGGFASSEFGHLTVIGERPLAIATWIYERISYELGSSDGRESAEDTLLLGRGTCRDFAHLGVALCRSLGMPARFVAVYAPGLSPMDFHAVFEAFHDGRWWVYDPTRLAPRQSLVRIATGRDASDTAFFSVFPDTVELVGITIGAVVNGDLPVDDHSGLVELA